MAQQSGPVEQRVESLATWRAIGIVEFVVPLKNTQTQLTWTTAAEFHCDKAFAPASAPRRKWDGSAAWLLSL